MIGISMFRQSHCALQTGYLCPVSHLELESLINQDDNVSVHN